MWLRLRQIALVANQLQPALDDLKAVLGIDVCFVDPGVKSFGLENSLLPVGNQFLEVVAPIQDGTAGGRYLERRGGDGGYMVITQCDDHAPRVKRVNDLGVRIAWSFEDPGHYKCMQLHPKDTGATFFEIDEQLGAGAHDADGPWHPAGGKGWKKGQRLDRVSGIAAVELQVNDPAATAQRWADIAQCPLVTDAAGNPVVQLDNATLRFVPCRDGRPEGLGGIDVNCTDRAAVLAAAREWGAYRSDDLIHLVGMRVNLV
jgi:hypothetical protein